MNTIKEEFIKWCILNNYEYCVSYEPSQQATLFKIRTNNKVSGLLYSDFELNNLLIDDNAKFLSIITTLENNLKGGE